MTIETLHYHFGKASYRIQFDVIPVPESKGNMLQPTRFRASLIRAKRLGHDEPLQYFNYSRDFGSESEARRVTSEYAKSQVRQQYFKGLKQKKRET